MIVHLKSRPLRTRLQHFKSVAHSKIQLHLKSLIPGSLLEKSFPSIGRIADVVWEEKKIVFEIQCSPISKEEAQSRCQDYESLGYTPVWILYSKRFNRKKLSKAEKFLRTRVCFFADGFKIYDQFEVIQERKRLFLGPPLSVELHKPLLPAPSLENPILAISERSWPISFEGDLLDRVSKGELEGLKTLELQFQKKLKNPLWKRLYKEWLYFLLSRLSD